MSQEPEVPPQGDEGGEPKTAPKPIRVGPPRVAGLDVEQAERLIAELDGEVDRYVGAYDHRHAPAYVSRAHLRFAAGYAAPAVLDDFWMASRCLAGEPALHLSRHAPEQLLTRRITPVEVGILGGQLDLARRLAAGYGLPTLAIRAGLASEELLEEGRLLSPGLLGEPIKHPQHLLGLAAAAYAGALGSAIRGFEDEVALAIHLVGEVRFMGTLNAGEREVMVRYAGLCEVLLELVRSGERDLGGMLADQIERYTSRLAASLGEGYTSPKQPVRYIDTSSLTLLGLASMLDRDMLGFPPNPEVTPSAAAYKDFVEAMSQQHRAPLEVGELVPEVGQG